MVSRNSNGGTNAARAARRAKRERSPAVVSIAMASTPARSSIRLRTVQGAGQLSGRRAPGGGDLGAVLDVVLLHLAVQRRPVQPEDLRRLLLVPVGPLQRLQDRHLLDLGQRAVRRDDELGRRRALGAKRFRQ